MTEIEERAKKALEEYESKLKYHKTICEDDFFEDGYIKGATEQKAIDDAELAKVEKSWIENSDSLNIHLAFNMGKIQSKREMIDKACEWLRNNLGYYDRHEVHIGKSYEEVVIDDFRKAMEE